MKEIMVTYVVALLGVGAAVAAVLALHMLLARKGLVWLGGLIPALWVVAVVVLASQGRLEPGRPYLVACAGFVMLVWMWAGARKTRNTARTPEPAEAVNDGP